MSERQVLLARSEDTTIEGCTSGESAVCLDLCSCLVRHAAGVLSGVKPASLFGYVARGGRGVLAGERSRTIRDVLSAAMRALAGEGLKAMVLDVSDQRYTLLVYRPAHVAHVLADPDARDFLRALGYEARGCDEVMRTLYVRMRSYYGAADRSSRPEYPHEVGLVLGYPLEDVRGFMEGGCETCRGPWRAFGDERRSRATFGRVARCEGRCRERYRQGECFGSIVRRPVVSAV